MEKRRGKMIFNIMGILFGLILITVVFFLVPVSPTKTEFTNIANGLTVKTGHETGRFTEADIAGLPQPVQKYFRYCGYIGTPKMSYIKIAYKDVDFALGNDKPVIKIDYTQYNFVNEPNRIAYVDSSMYGIPFEGLDSYIDGAGSMKGVIAKLYPLFHQTGKNMDKSSLVTFLSESLIVPAAALQDYIVWESLDDLHAKATINYYGMYASGIFTFNDMGEMICFVTDDREATAMDGTSEKVRWSIKCSDYQDRDGVKKPTVFRAIWNYAKGDFVYFDGTGTITGYI